MASADVSHLSRDATDLLKKCSELKEGLRLDKCRLADTHLSEVTADVAELPSDYPLFAMKQRKILKGHQRKVLYFDWCPDSRHVLSGAQDSFAYVWDGFTSHKDFELQLQGETWVTTCAYAPNEAVIALGGMHCKCVVYRIDSKDTIKATQTRHVIGAHNGVITSCSFLSSDQQLITGSADKTCALWDVEKLEPVFVFKGHTREVLELDTHPKEPFSIFASAGSDHTVRIWDIRSGKCVMKFDGHDSDVNAVRFFPTSESIGTASDDGSAAKGDGYVSSVMVSSFFLKCRLFDLRADQEVCIYTTASILFGASSLDFSKSGRVMFVGYNDHTLRAWDTLKETHLAMWIGHQDRLSHVQMSPDGMALCTSSWDGTLAIWA